MEYSDKLKSMLTKEVDEIAKKGELSSGALEALHKLTDTIKNINKIEMLEESNAYNEGASSHDGETSNGRHYVRGHYSYNNDMSRHDDAYRYSRADGTDYILSQLENMLRSVNSDRDRQCIEYCMSQLENRR